MKTEQSTSLTVNAATHEIVPSSLTSNPNRPAALALAPDPDMPADVQMLGKDPWTDYLRTAEGLLLVGEIVTVVRRYEEEDQKDGSKVLKPRPILVLRTVADGQICQRKHEPGDPVRGEIQEEKERGVVKRTDVYKVPRGTLVACNFRTIMKPFLPFAFGAEAAEAYIKILGQQESKRNSKERYWDMRIGVRRLGYERDTSLDYLTQEAERARADLEIPFLSDTRDVMARPHRQPRNLPREATELLKTSDAIGLDVTIESHTREKVVSLLNEAASLLLAASRSRSAVGLA